MVINKGASDTIYECAITVSLCLPFALQEQVISLSAEKCAVACRKGMKLVHQITLHDKIVNINIRTANTQEVLSNEKNIIQPSRWHYTIASLYSDNHHWISIHGFECKASGERPYYKLYRNHTRSYAKAD